MNKAIEIQWDLLGAQLALLDSEKQADFFKGFAREMDNYDSKYKAESQMAFINLELEDRDKKVLEFLLPTLYYKDDE